MEGADLAPHTSAVCVSPTGTYISASCTYRHLYLSIMYLHLSIMYLQTPISWLLAFGWGDAPAHLWLHAFAGWGDAPAHRC